MRLIKPMIGIVQRVLKITYIHVFIFHGLIVTVNRDAAINGFHY